MIRALLWTSAACAALGQPKTPAFEMADVRVTPPRGPSMGAGVLAGGRFQASGETLLALIARAYGIPDDRIYGGPDWLDTDRFDVFATASPEAVGTSLRPMLQGLLAERFKLVVHQDSKPVPVYALVAGKRMLLKESNGSGEAGCRWNFGDNQQLLNCHQTTIDGFIAKLRDIAGFDLDRPLEDATGLKRAYDFTLRWTPRHLIMSSRSNGADAPGTSLLAAIEKQLGLKVENRREPLPVLAIDRVSRTPVDSGPPAFPTAFAAAEVRASAPGAKGSADITHDRFVYYAITIKRLLAIAYNVGDERIAGGPEWLDKDQFDVIAKAPVPVPVPVLRTMLATLLSERFKVAFHTEDRQAPVFALSTGRSPKLKKADPATRSRCKITLGDTGRIYACQNTTMEQLARKVHRVQTNIINLEVVDLTGLKGAYDFAVAYDPAGRITYDANGDPAIEASTPTGYLPFLPAMERQLGLKLQKQNHPMPVMVIDHVERVPVEN